MKSEESTMKNVKKCAGVILIITPLADIWQISPQVFIMAHLSCGYMLRRLISLQKTAQLLAAAEASPGSTIRHMCLSPVDIS